MKAISEAAATFFFGLIFFAVITPLGILLRFFGYDPLRLSPKPSSSAFIGRNTHFSKASFETES
jgi:hypothetical protein